MNESKQIEVNSSSIIDLKAELYRKQESFRLKKLSQSQQQVVENDTNLYDINCNQIKYKLGKRIREKSDKEMVANIKRKYGMNAIDIKEPKLSEEDIEVEKALQKSRQMLQKKSLLYEKLSKNPNLLIKNEDDFEEEMDDRILVDFHQKSVSDRLSSVSSNNLKTQENDSSNLKVDYKEDNLEEEEEEEEEWTEFIDSLGRSRKCLKKDLQHFIDTDRQTFGHKKIEEMSRVASNLSSVPNLTKNNELLSDDLRRELERRDWETNATNEVITKRQSEEQNTNNRNIHYQNVQYNEIRDHGVAYYSFAEDQTTRQQQMDALKQLRDQTMQRKEQKQKLKEKRKQLMRERLAKVAQRKGIAFQPKESSSESEELSDVEPTLPEPKLIPNSVREWDVGKPELPEVLSELKSKSVYSSNRSYVEERRDERNPEFAPPSAYNRSQPKNNFTNKTNNLISEKSRFGENSKKNTDIGSDLNNIYLNSNKNSDNNIDSNVSKQDVNQVISNALFYFRNNLKQ